MVGVVPCFALIVAALVGCVQSNATVCGDGRVCPPGHRCDLVRDRCITPEQEAACRGLVDGDPCTIGGVAGICAFGACEPLICGDGLVTGSEQCDGSIGEATCRVAGFYEPDGLQCSPACTFDVSGCRGRCGDGEINGPELCDGQAPLENCVDLGYDAGPTDCSTLCSADVTSCARFGWRATALGAMKAQAIGGPAPDNLWAVGDAGAVAHFDGKTWTTGSAGVQQSLLAVWPIAANDVWAIGVGTPNIVVHYDGVAWTTVTGIPAAEYVDVWAAGNNAVFVATADQDVLWWNGTAWQQLGVLAGDALAEIDGTSSSDLWVVKADGSLLRWNGSTWSPTSVPGMLVEHLDVVAVDTVWVSGRTVTFEGVVARWDGQTWTTWPTPLLTAISATASNDAWGAEPNGDVRHYDGLGWTTTDVVGRSLAALVSFGPKAVFGVTYDPGTVSRFSGQALDVSTTGAIANNILWDDGPDDLYAGAGNRLFHHDGDAWSSYLLPAGEFAEAIWGSGQGDVWALTASASLYRFTPAPTLISQAPGAVHVLWGGGPNDVWALGTSAHRFDGSNWTTYAIPATGPITGASGSGTNDIWAIVGGSTPEVVRWNGVDWQAVAIPATSELVAIHVLAPNSVFVAAAPRSLFYWNGTTWSEQQVPLTLDIDAVTASATDDLFVSSATELVHFDGSRWSPVRHGVDTTSSPPGYLAGLVMKAPNRLHVLSNRQVRSLYRSRLWVCRATETGCADGVDDDCDDRVDALDSDCP